MTNHPKTVEEQYGLAFEVLDKHGRASMGLAANVCWATDPKKFLFTAARYKFVSRMLEGRKAVLEVGCSDAFPSRIVQQTVGHLTALDIDPVFVEDAKKLMDPAWPLTLDSHDMVKGPYSGQYNAAYCLDVLEHIQASDEDAFVSNVTKSLTPEGVMIVGIPSLESQTYASPQSKAGHVNCKTGKDLKALMEKYFHTVFMFSMNDEVVHTGFQPMAHYLFAVCSHMRTTD